MLPPYTRKQRLALAIVPTLVTLLLKALGATLRYTDVSVDAVCPGNPLQQTSIYVFWHRCILANVYRFRDKNVGILISQSFDGELIARIVQRFGFTPVRGSSTRGGSVALMGMERAFREGYVCAITADGPRGPAMVAKPGAAQLAKLTGGDVSVCYAFSERAWQLKTWDRFLIPKPFSRVFITWPRVVASEDATGAAVQAALDRAVEMSKNLEQS